MNTGAYTNSTTFDAQTLAGKTASIDSSAILYQNSDTGYLRWGFAEGSIVTIGSTTHGDQTATIDSIESGSVTFIENVDVEIGDTMTKNYTGPHKTQAEANRKRVLGFR